MLCSQEYIQRKEREVYLNTQLFDDIIPFVKEMRRLGFFMIISSSTEEKIIKKILKTYEINDSFIAVMGKESISLLKIPKPASQLSRVDFTKN